MEACHGLESDHGHIIEVCADVAPNGGIRLCGSSRCGLSDAKTNSIDVKERTMAMRKLIFAVVLCIIFMVVEVVGGIKANSLAILTDAAHLLSDVAGFGISLFSLWASGWEANPRQSYGFFRIEILGALVSMQLIWLLAGILVFEAVQRLLHETGEVHGVLMFAVSAVGLVVNVIMALVLGHEHHGHSHGHGHDHGHAEGHSHCHHESDHEHIHDHNEPLLTQPEAEPCHKKHKNINIQSAYLHALGDLSQSIAVMISGIIIWFKPEWKIIDLICTILFSVAVLATTIKMLRNILEVLMESTPREIDATRLEQGLCEMEEIVTVHELHIWAITVGKILLACHVIIKPDTDSDNVLDNVIQYLRKEYNITHVTIQIERQQLQ